MSPATCRVSALIDAANRARDPHMARVLIHKAGLVQLRAEVIDMSSTPPLVGEMSAASGDSGGPSLMPALIALTALAAFLALTPAALWAF